MPQRVRWSFRSTNYFGSEQLVVFAKQFCVLPFWVIHFSAASAPSLRTKNDFFSGKTETYWVLTHHMTEYPQFNLGDIRGYHTNEGKICLFITSYHRTLKRKLPTQCSYTIFSRALQNSWRIINTIASIPHENTVVYLSLDFFCFSKMSFPRASLSEKRPHLATYNVHGQEPINSRSNGLLPRTNIRAYVRAKSSEAIVYLSFSQKPIPSKFSCLPLNVSRGVK